MSELIPAVNNENNYLGMEINALVKEYRQIKDQAQEESKRLDETKRVVAQMDEALIAYSFDHPDTEKHTTKGAGTITFAPETVFSVNKDNWDNFHQWVKTHDAFYLLQRRINTAPIKEMVNAGLPLPPVESFNRTKVGFRRS
jgi:hypothetical protein